jgi:hypothetical protein
MEFRDRQTQEAVDKAVAMLAAAYQRWQRARRVEGVNRELDNPRPESLHVHEVDA